MSHSSNNAAGLDAVDRVLLETLTDNSRLANNRLAARAEIAPSTALARVKALVDRAVIHRFTVEVDPVAVGRPVQAIIALRLRSHDRAHIATLMRLLPTLPEVVQSFHVAGDDDWLLHVAVPSAEALRDFVLDHLTVHEAVVHTRTTLVFSHDHGHTGPL
jgi:DNA-binding Lrp family transcriptional regulator